MPRKNIKVFDFAGSRMLYRVDSEHAATMIDRGVCYRLQESPLTLALSRPPKSADDKRGMVQSRHLSAAKTVASRGNENRGRGTLLRGGKSLGFKNALLAVAADTADAETTAAFEAWKPKMKLAPTPSNAGIVNDRAILFFPNTGNSQ